MSRIYLRQLILGLTLISILLTLTNVIISSYRVQRDLLLETSLEANRTYAMKLADSTNLFLTDVLLQLRYSADALMGRRGAPLLDDPSKLNEEMHRLKVQTNAFNGTHVVDADGIVLANSSNEASTIGLKLHSEGAQQALQARRPMISSMYRAQTGRRILLVSMPLFDPEGTYRGYIGGALYLDESNVLHNLLGQHYYKDGSYIYVVDQSGFLVYHADPSRIGEQVLENPAVRNVLSGQSGSLRGNNTKGVDMLIGYSPILLPGWGIIAQQPTQAVLARQQQLLLQTLAYSIPLLLLSLIGVWIVSHRISGPLSQLAQHSRRIDDVELTQARITGIRAWYFEAAQLKQSLLAGLSLLGDKIRTLRDETFTDQLTGLVNRRGMDRQTAAWEAAQRPFSVLLLDVDHFKHINDAHGHDVGDKVLRHLAELMRQNARGADLACRSGGEEFSIFLPDTSLDSARQIAERLRMRVKERALPGGDRITVSIGVARYPDMGTSIEQVLKAADTAMYRAKRMGRDRVVVADPNSAAAHHDAHGATGEPH